MMAILVAAGVASRTLCRNEGVLASGAGPAATLASSGLARRRRIGPIRNPGVAALVAAVVGVRGFVGVEGGGAGVEGGPAADGGAGVEVWPGSFFAALDLSAGVFSTWVVSI